MLIHNADVIKIRVSLPKGLWAKHSDKHTSFVSVLYPAWPLIWISGVAAEGKAPLETDVQSAGLTWGIKMKCVAGLPDPPLSFLELWDIPGAQQAAGNLPQGCPWPAVGTHISSQDQTRSGRASLAPWEPFEGWWERSAARSCPGQAAGRQWGSDPHAPAPSEPTHPLRLLGGPVLHTPALFRADLGDVCTRRPQNKSSLIHSSTQKGGYYFLITCSCGRHLRIWNETLTQLTISSDDKICYRFVPAKRIISWNVPRMSLFSHMLKTY